MLQGIHGVPHRRSVSISFGYSPRLPSTDRLDRCRINAGLSCVRRCGVPHRVRRHVLSDARALYAPHEDCVHLVCPARLRAR